MGGLFVLAPARDGHAWIHGFCRILFGDKGSCAGGSARECRTIGTTIDHAINITALHTNRVSEKEDVHRGRWRWAEKQRALRKTRRWRLLQQIVWWLWERMSRAARGKTASPQRSSFFFSKWVLVEPINRGVVHFGFTAVLCTAVSRRL